MNRKPSCTEAVTESLVPAFTTPTTCESRLGAVRTFNVAVAYLLPITFSAGFGTGLAVGRGFGFGFVRDGTGLTVGLGLGACRSTGSWSAAATELSTVGWLIAGAG
jgi:hypothetical protein